MREHADHFTNDRASAGIACSLGTLTRQCTLTAGVQQPVAPCSRLTFEFSLDVFAVAAGHPLAGGEGTAINEEVQTRVQTEEHGLSLRAARPAS